MSRPAPGARSEPQEVPARAPLSDTPKARPPHSAAPWRAGRNLGRVSVYDANACTVCDMAMWSPGVDAADALLIAAAPDLLAALKLARAYVVASVHLTVDIQQIDAAIARAEVRS